MRWFFVSLLALLFSPDLSISADAAFKPIIAHIKSHAVRTKTSEYAEARKIIKGDVGGNGIEKVVALYTLEGFSGSNDYRQFIVIQNNRQTATIQVGGKGLREVQLVGIEGGKILLETMEYRQSDPLCCPSMPDTMLVSWSGKNLFEERPTRTISTSATVDNNKPSGARENVFWTFSSSAQSVAALVAFLLAGYTLVHMMMESAAQADETLIEIHDELKKRYHRKLSALSIITAFAIVTCLLAVYFNGKQEWLVWVASFFTLCAIIGSVYFVITIVDPRKYSKAARQMAREVEPVSRTSARASRGDFIECFIDIERLVREIWEVVTQGERLGGKQGPPAMREMLEVLKMDEILPKNLYILLQNVNRHRNLIIHGHVEEVDPRILDEAKQVLQNLQLIQESEAVSNRRKASGVRTTHMTTF